MSRPRKLAPASIRHDLKKNNQTDLYELTEEGIIYSFPFECLHGLKLFISNSLDVSLADWYRSLPKEDRVKVFLTKSEERSTEFYLDYEYE